MEPYETHLGVATALAVGLLVGLEREQTKGTRGGQIGGVRTFAVVALVGALATLLGPASLWVPLIALLGVISLVAISYAADVKKDTDRGMTTEITVIGVYLLAALAVSRGVIEPMEDRLLLVAAIGVAMTFLLSSKEFFHNFAQRVSRDDFYATVKFLIVAVIALPLLPNRDMGPLGAINPRTLGMLVVMISGLSFLGYVAMRLWGARRGLILSAALGGLVSSTAVTLSFSRRAKDHPDLAPMAAGAIAIAWLIMLGRVAIVVALIDAPLMRTLGIPLGAMFLGGLIGFVLTFRRSGEMPKMELKNPFELGSAIKVTFMFAVVLLASRAAVEYVGDGGLYLAAALGGSTDVDAITVSTAKLAQSTISHDVATITICIGIAVNTIVKAGLAIGLGGSALGKRVSLTGLLVLLGGGVGIAVVTLL
ncbi:MAG: MgtC/SapB family protein [Deltaproteobacteria bacterium]|nr:MgtC/SapB family protein [Deltaproteobacteria bacterium]